MASISTTGMPSRLPPRVGTLAATRTSAAVSSAATASLVMRPARVTRSASPWRSIRSVEGRAVRSVPDEPARERHAPVGQEPAGLDEVGLALDLVQRPDGDDPQRPVDATRSVWHEGGRVDAAVDDLDLASRAAPAGLLDEPPVVLRDGHHERGLGDLRGQHRPVDVQVGAVGREAVRDPDQPVDEEPGEGRVVGEVAVDVLDALGLHLPGGVGDLREDAQPAEQEVRAAPRAAEHVREGCAGSAAAGAGSRRNHSWVRRMAGDRNGR